MDEHGIAAALLPLVTAFCRVSMWSVLTLCTALSILGLLGGRRGWQPGRGHIVPLVLGARGPAQSLPARVVQALGPRLPRGLEDLQEECSDTGAALKHQLDEWVKLGWAEILPPQKHLWPCRALGGWVLAWSEKSLEKL